jgi:hypothetical protein
MIVCQTYFGKKHSGESFVKQEIKKEKSIEELLKWQEELHELEKYAVSGKPISEEQMAKNVKEVLDPNFWRNELERVRNYKQKLLQKLALAENHEQFLAEVVEREEKAQR